jgi:hypothetical protein
MAQQQDPIKALERRVKKLERALNAVIEHTGSSAPVDAAEAAWETEMQAKGADARERLSDLSRGGSRRRP